jgi:transcriptional regulator with XRE-family HTH domain
VSYDESGRIGENARMDRMTETEERAAFIGRVRAARMARYETQKPMLVILGLDQGTYKQYETRSPLPHRYLPKFCAATGVTLEWLLTGEGAGPMTIPLPEKRKRTIKRGRSKAA